MIQKLNISWPRIFAEGIAIVASILLAFWIQAWWDETRDREDERIILSGLLEEFREIAQQRELDRNYSPAMQDSARRLLTHKNSVAADISEREIDALIADVTWTMDTNVLATPVLDSLIFGGNLEVMSNQVLLLTLTGIHATIYTTRDPIKIEVEFMQNRLLPYLESNGSLAQIYAADDGQPGIPQTGAWPYGSELDAPTIVSHRELLSHLEFQNLLVQRINLLTYVNLSMSILDVQLETVIDILEQELSR